MNEVSLFRNEKFILDKMTKWLTSKFAIFVWNNISELWSILVGHFIKKEALISEECRSSHL